MRTAEEIFNVSSKNLDSGLADFYKAAEEAILKSNPGMKNELKYYSKLPMHLIPFEERTKLIRQYRDAIQFDEALLGMRTNASPLNPAIGDGVLAGHRQDVSNIYSSLRTSMAADADHAFGRLPADNMGGSPLSRIYSSLNIQFRQRLQPDRAGLIGATWSQPHVGSTAASYFTIGLNSIPTARDPKAITYEPGKNMLTGKSTLIYDIETAGLAKGQIREVSYSVGGKSEQLLFNPKEFRRGLVNVNGQAGDLSDFLRAKHGLNIPQNTVGDGFASQMRPFLEAVNGSDFIVGHNITGFDNEQVFVGLSRTDLYKNDSGFRELVDKAFEKVRTSSIDTLDVAKQMPSLAALETADEIAEIGSHSVYSIQNLLLKTDLAERIGIKNLHGMVASTGLHHANIDVAVTSAILDAAEAGGLQIKDLGEGLQGTQLGRLAEQIRKEVVSSSAITPVSNLTEVGQITDNVLNNLVETYRYNENSGLMAESGSELDKLLRGTPTDRAKAVKSLRSGQLTPQSIRLTPIEQQIISERNLERGTAQSTGSIFDKVTSRLKIRMAKDTGEAQRLSKAAGIPFAGLSGDERTIAYGVSRATANLDMLSGPEARVADLASDTLVSRFSMFDPEKVQYITSSGRASLPASLVDKVIKKNDLVSLSVVEGTSGNSGGAINVVKSLNENEADSLRTFLKDLSAQDDEAVGKALGYQGAEDGASAVQRFRGAIDEGLLERIDKRGVSIAQVHGKGNRGSIQAITNVFKKHFNVDGQLEDRAMKDIVFPIMDIDQESGLVRTGGAVLNKGLGRKERGVVRSAVNETRKVYNEYLRAPLDQPKDFRMAQMASKVSDTISSDIVQKIYANVQDKIIPNLGKGLVGAVAVGAGALLFSRHKENQTLNETLEFQGWESSAPGQYGVNQQIQQRIDMGYDGYTNLMDPLATASVMNNLNSSRTGHSNFDWSRNNQLYGGLL